MELEEGIGKLLDGDAIMFAGAGCSAGATNLRDKPLFQGSDLAKYFAEKTGLTDGELSLEDATEAFLEKYGESALIREIKNEFTTKVLADYHIQLGSFPWKRIYTTNYDDVLEEAYKENPKLLIPITASDDPFKTPRGQTPCIHLNGFVHKLDTGNIGTGLNLPKQAI